MNKIIRRIVMAAMLGLVSYQASAAEELYSKEYSVCLNNSGGVTVNILECISAETEHQDVLLNKAYRDLRAVLTAERKRELLEAQRAWLKYRDLNCKFYAGSGGTLAAIASNDCFLKGTAVRAGELKQIPPY